MPSIRIQNMGGIAPKVSARLLPLSAAQIAESTKLWSGEVHAFRTGRPLPDPMPSAPVRTIFHISEAWLAWKTDVDVVIGFTPNAPLGRVYYTGDGAPKVIDQVQAKNEAPTPTGAFPLGVQPPPHAPICSTTTPGSPQEARTYIYTFVTLFNEESVPSPPSDVIIVQDGVAVHVDYSESNPPPNVDRVRIYRSNGGPFVFVKEAMQFVGFWDDAATNEEIEGNEQLVSQYYYPAPANMQGLVGTPNGWLAGFFENKVYFSVPYQPHAWPPAYVKYFDYPIVGLGVFGTTVAVFTTGPTYLVDGMDPENLSVDRVPDVYPCVSKRSIATGDRGVYYACATGLAFVGSGGVQLVSKDVLDEDDWKVWHPDTMHGTVFDGYYYGFFRGDRQTSSPNENGAGFIFDINDRATGSFDKVLLTTIPFYSPAIYAGLRRRCRRCTSGMQAMGWSRTSGAASSSCSPTTCRSRRARWWRSATTRASAWCACSTVHAARCCSSVRSPAAIRSACPRCCPVSTGHWRSRARRMYRRFISLRRCRR
jgi:hypothetical protein